MLPNDKVDKMRAHLVPMKVCGCLEIHCLSYEPSALDALKTLWPQLQSGNTYGKMVPFILFSGTIGHRISPWHSDYTKVFADFIEENKLGTIVMSQVKTNWTGSRLRLVIWSPDYDKIASFLEKADKPKRAAKKIKE